MADPRPWSDAAIALCPLGAWDGDPRRCRWCNLDLVGRQRRWCATCGRPGQGYAGEHDWQSARLRALHRDGRTCRRCGWREGQALDAGKWIAAHDPEVAALVTANRQGSDAATTRALRDFRLTYAAVENVHRLEVNHITPVMGRHRQAGCHHHTDGLETLCHPCHVVVTARQTRLHLPGAA